MIIIINAREKNTKINMNEDLTINYNNEDLTINHVVLVETNLNTTQCCNQQLRECEQKQPPIQQCCKLQLQEQPNAKLKLVGLITMKLRSKQWRGNS